MNYLNADTMESHTGSMAISLNKVDEVRPPPTYTELKIRCELLEAEAAIQNRAMGDMSKEICELNNQITDMLDQLVEMK